MNLSHAQTAVLDSIFFEASGTKQFASAEARAAFRQMWLGNYLTDKADHAFVALGGDNIPVGYLVGSLDDPAADPLQAGIGYFHDLAPHTRRYPAQLHVNLAPAYRSHGLGARLVETFCAHAAAHGAPGVHVVTGQGLRNVAFYTRLGFQEVAQVVWNDRPLVMLARALP